jgi:hypothetical protein
LFYYTHITDGTVIAKRELFSLLKFAESGGEEIKPYYRGITAKREL